MSIYQIYTIFHSDEYLLKDTSIQLMDATGRRHGRLKPPGSLIMELNAGTVDTDTFTQQYKQFLNTQIPYIERQFSGVPAIAISCYCDRKVKDSIIYRDILKDWFIEQYKDYRYKGEILSSGLSKE